PRTGRGPGRGPAPPGHTPRPARRANGGVGSLVPRLETLLTPDGDAPGRRPRLLAWPVPTLAACAPAPGAPQSLARLQEPSTHRRVPASPRRPGGNGRGGRH